MCLRKKRGGPWAIFKGGGAFAKNPGTGAPRKGKLNNDTGENVSEKNFLKIFPQHQTTGNRQMLRIMDHIVSDHYLSPACNIGNTYITLAACIHFFRGLKPMDGSQKTQRRVKPN